MQKIAPFLWFDREAGEAAKFYTSVFPKSKINNIRTMRNTPSGTVEIVNIDLFGQDFTLMSAGPFFKFNQSISFMVNFDPSRDKNAKNSLEIMWKKLSDGGKVLMDLQQYPWSKLYGWVQDRYGVGWQLILTNPAGEERPGIVPVLLFVEHSYGKAEDARKFYLSVFKNSEKGNIMHYGKGQEPNKEGTVMFSDFRLENMWLVAMDGGGKHNFAFNEAISFVVNCDDQKEVDYYGGKLSHDPKAEQCGWLKDKYGVSWQIVPKVMNELISKDNSGRVTQAMLRMKKINIEELENAYKKA